MTGKTTNEKLRAVLLAAMMVISVVAMTTAFAGSAAAAATAVNGSSAGDIEIGQESVSQDVTFSTTIDGSDATETYTLDVSDAESNSSSVSVTGDGSDVAITGTDAAAVSVNSVTDNSDTDGEIVIDINDGAQDDTAHSFTITVTLTHDTSGSSGTSGDANEITLTSNSNTGTVSYDYYGVSLDKDRVIVGSTHNVEGTVHALADGTTVNYSVTTPDSTEVVTGQTNTESFQFSADFNQEGHYTVTVDDGTTTTSTTITSIYDAEITTTPDPLVYQDTVNIQGTLTDADGNAIQGKILKFNDPSGTERGEVTTTSNGGFSFTASVANDAGMWTITNSSLTYKEVPVTGQETDLSLTADNGNLAYFAQTYNLQLNDSVTGDAIMTEADTNATGYINVTGPFDETLTADGTTITTVNTTDVDGDGDTDTDYIHINTNSTGAASFSATPIGSDVTATLENGANSGLEVTDDAADTASSPDYTGSVTSDVVQGQNVNVVDFDIQDQQTESPQWASIDLDNDDEFGEADNQTIKALPVADAQGDRLIGDHRVGNDSETGVNGITTYNFTLDVRNGSNTAYTFDGDAGANISEIQVVGAGVNKTITSADHDDYQFNDGGDATLDDGNEEHNISFTPTQKDSVDDNVTLTFVNERGDEYTATFGVDALRIEQFNVDDNNGVNSVEVGSQIDIDSVVTTDDGTPVNNGRVRVTQKTSAGDFEQHAQFDARTDNTNDGVYTFGDLNITRTAVDTDGDGIAEADAPLVFTAYQYADADNDQALEQNEVNKATVRNLNVAPASNLQISFSAEEEHEYMVNDGESANLTAGVDYDNVTITVTDQNGEPVDLTNGAGGVDLSLNDIATNDLITIDNESVSLSADSDPVNGTYVIDETDIDAKNETDSKVAFWEDGEHDIDVVRPQMNNSDASGEGTFTVGEANVDSEVTQVELQDGSVVSLENASIEKLTAGVDRNYTVEIAVTDAAGETVINGSEDGINGIVDLTESDDGLEFNKTTPETVTLDENGTAAFNVTEMDGTNLTVRYNVSQSASISAAANDGPTAYNPVVEVYDRSGADLPESDDTNNSILAKDTQNQLRIEAFPADPEDVMLPDGLSYGFGADDPKAENTAGTTTSLSEDVVTDDFEEGQLGYVSVTPTGTGQGIMHLNDEVNGSGNQVVDMNGNDVVFDTLNSNLQVNVDLSSSTVGAGENVTVTLTQQSTGDDLNENVRVSLVNPSGNEIGSALTDEDGQATLTVPTGASTSGTYSVETRPAGFAPNSADLNVELSEVPLNISANATDVSTGDTVEFTVTNADTGAAMDDATVEVDGTELSTDANGTVEYTFEDEGDFTATATKANSDSETYVSDSVTITVGDDSDDDNVTDDELVSAIISWQNGELSDDELVSVIINWQNS